MSKITLVVEKNNALEVYPIRSSLVKPDTELSKAIIAAFSKAKLNPRSGDLVVVTSKVVAVSEGQLSGLSKVRVGAVAARLARKYRMDQRFMQTILDEADSLYRGVPGAVLTLKDGDAVANAGADQKNSPAGTVVLWPRDPDRSASKLREELEHHYGKRLGVLITDSRVTPLRLGTVGLALATAGFDPVKDIRGHRDLYGRTVRITTMAVADGIAGAAHLVMGESDESTPFALVRNAPVSVDGRNRGKVKVLISPNDCLYMSNLARESVRY